ncbi:MAG: acetolactate synthase small subunit [Candidatus Brocadiales bacterium]
MKHTISATVENKVGVLARIVGLFSSRGFNIDSLNVGETEDPNLSRLTIVVNGDDAVLEQVRKQLGKVIDVVKVSDLTGLPYVERDLMLVKINVPPGKRGEILEVVDIFRGKIVDVGQKDMIVELSGAEDKVEAMLKLLRPYGVKETARTGQIAMARGAK